MARATKKAPAPSPRQPSCADRLPEHLSGRLSDFRTLTKALQGEELTDEELREVTNLREPDQEEYDEEKLRELAAERQNEYPLSVEKLTVVKVLLSTGGPADWFECWCDTDGTIERIDYVFQDWFDGARRTLEGEDFRTAEAFLQDYVNIVTENY